MGAVMKLVLLPMQQTEVRRMAVGDVRVETLGKGRHCNGWAVKRVEFSKACGRIYSGQMSVSVTSVETRQQVREQVKDASEYVYKEIETVSPQQWHSATVVKVEDVASGVRCITLSAECSRELVSLDDAYTKPGQLVSVKVDGVTIDKVPVSSPPFSNKANHPVLYKIRGDIPAGATKIPQFTLSVKAHIDLHVIEADMPVLFRVQEGDEIELGPFAKTGLDLRPVMFLSRFPTLLVFAQGKGIAVGRAILECQDADMGSLNLGLREDVRLYYSALKPSLLAYKQRFQEWEEKKVTVRTVVRKKSGEKWDGIVGTFGTLWDEDDIEYDPGTTGVVVCVERSERKELKRVLEQAGIPDSQVVIWDV